MAARDLFVMLVVFGSVPFCITRPYVGIYVWCWLSYMNPHRLAWGIAYDFPLAQVVALATLAGFVLLAARGRLPPLPFERETILLILLWLTYTFSTMFAMQPRWAWPEWQEISKILLVTFLTLILIDDRKKLRHLLLIMALSLGFYGIKGGIFSILTAGQSKIWGPPRSFIADNNALALALNMILPMLFYFSRTESDKRVRLLFLAGFFLTALAVMFTYSRGGFLGLSVVLALIVLRSGLKVKVALAVLLVLAAPIALQFVPEQWFQRMNTIGEYEQDESAMSRIAAWKVAWFLALDRPLTGGGFRAIDNADLYRVYEVESGLNTGVHSIYFEVLGENGFIALFFFLLLLGSSLLSLRRLRRSIRGHPNLQVFQGYSLMLEVGLSAYAVSGAFLELAGFDLFYHFVAVTVIMKTLVDKELHQEPARVPFRPSPGTRQSPLPAQARA